MVRFETHVYTKAVRSLGSCGSLIFSCVHVHVRGSSFMINPVISGRYCFECVCSHQMVVRTACTHTIVH